MNLTCPILTPPSRCRMTAKLTFMVIDMKAICKHIAKVGDKHKFLMQKFIKMGESRIIYISAKLSSWHFKRNILRKMIVLDSQSINLFQEKCILSQIPIANVFGTARILPNLIQHHLFEKLKFKLQPRPTNFRQTIFSLSRNH